MFPATEIIIECSTDHSDHDMSSAFLVHGETGNHILNLVEKWPHHHQHQAKILKSRLGKHLYNEYQSFAIEVIFFLE